MTADPLTTSGGHPVSVLGLGTHPDQDVACVDAAFGGGINYFFFYSLNSEAYVSRVAGLLGDHSDELFVAAGSEKYGSESIGDTLKRTIDALGGRAPDIYYALYVNPDDAPELVERTLDELARCREDKLTRAVGVSCHSRALARNFLADRRVDVLMHRFNMAHRGPIEEVFPTANEHSKPIVAFTATRWGSLMKGHAQWSEPVPDAAECYRYCLGHSPVRVVLTAPETPKELAANLVALNAEPLTVEESRRWENYGDLIYGEGRDKFETHWP